MIELQKENKKTSTLTIMTVVLVVIATAVFGLLAIPSIKKLKTNSKKAAQAAYNLTAGQEYITNIDTAYKKLSANPEAVALLDTASPIYPDVAGAMTQLDGLVSDSGLNLNALSPSEEDDGSTKINILVSGSYENLQKFLASLENNLRPFTIDNIVLTSYETGGENLTAGEFSVEVSYAGSKVTQAESTESETVTVTSGGGNE